MGHMLGQNTPSTPRNSTDLSDSDYFDPGKLPALGPDTSNALTPVENMKDAGGGYDLKSHALTAGMDILGGLVKGLTSKPQHGGSNPSPITVGGEDATADLGKEEDDFQRALSSFRGY